MGCCGQNTTGAGAVSVDTGKRVNYTQGMLLGVDDFIQEQAYDGARRRELARELLGYGTVRGLQVAVEVDGSGPRVRVSPGMAWMPSGQPVCVPSEQCCAINAWLAKHDSEVNTAASGASLTVYVVLSSATCLTDNVPIPGEPCRSESELMQPSRVADCFTLELRLAPPAQIEEQAIRDFADWLAQVPVDSTSPPLSEAGFLEQLRLAAHEWLTPSSPHPGDFMIGSPPAGLGTTDALLRAALRLWVTELRPLWHARYGCAADPESEGGSDDAVLLAELVLSLTHEGAWQAQGEVGIVEDRRPILLSLRMVQELIAQNPAPEAGNTVVAAELFGAAATAGSDAAYSRADHSHGTPALPPLAGDASGEIGANQVVGLRGNPIVDVAPVDNDVLVFGAEAQQWAPRQMPMPAVDPPVALAFATPGSTGESLRFSPADHRHALPDLPDLAGDVVGPIRTNRIASLHGFSLSAVAPVVGDVLMYANLPPTRLPTRFPIAAWTPVTLTLPKPASVLPAALNFGQAGGAGSSVDYARADHSHSLPDLPPIAVGGDLGGTTGNARIALLQGVPVAAEKPQIGDVLSFDGSRWVPAAASTVRSGVEIVAAGTVVMTVDGNLTASAQVNECSAQASVLNVAIDRTRAPNLAMITIVVSGIASADASANGIVIKLTPFLFPAKTPLVITPCLAQILFASAAQIQFSIALTTSLAFPSGLFQCPFEISRFVPFKAK